MKYNTKATNHFMRVGSGTGGRGKVVDTVLEPPNPHRVRML